MHQQCGCIAVSACCHSQLTPLCACAPPPAPSQPLVLRQKDKTVLLPADTGAPGGVEEEAEDEGLAPTIFEDLDYDGSHGRWVGGAV